MTAHSFEFTDAVVLYAIAWAGASGANPEVLEPCFQHLDVLPTSQELNTAISKLVAAGLVQADGQRLFAGQRAAELFEHVVHLPARTIPALFEEFLATVAFPQFTMHEYFSDQEQRSARDACRRRVRNAMRNVNGRDDR